MSEPPDDVTSQTEDRLAPPTPGPTASSHSPTRGAQAASRARRIGGRPMPGPRVGADEPETAAEIAATSDKPADAVKLDKAAKVAKPDKSAKAAKPDKAAKAAKPAKAAKAATPLREPADAETLQRRIAMVGTVLAVISGLAAAAMLAIGIWLSHGVWWAKSSTTAHRIDERTQVLAAAKTCTAAILSYDYRKLDTFEKAGQACATGQLLTDYTKLMDQTVKQIAPQTKTVQVFQVAKAGVTSVSPDGTQWVVLIYGQEAVTSTSTTPGTPRLDLSTASVTLNKVGKTWLVSNMSTAS